MRNLFFESRLPIDCTNWKKTKAVLELCEKLDIKNIILEPKDSKIKIEKDLKNKISSKFNLNVYYRHPIKVDYLKGLRKELKKLNRAPQIISVESTNKEIQLKASKDSRVDIISFSNQKILKTLSKGVISLIKQNNSFLEFSLEPIMRESFSDQSRNLRNLYKNIHLALSFTNNIIISGNFHELYQIRNPRGLISISHTILELSLFTAKQCFRENVKRLLERVKMRKDQNLIENGVKLFRS